MLCPIFPSNIAYSAEPPLSMNIPDETLIKHSVLVILIIQIIYLEPFHAYFRMLLEALKYNNHVLYHMRLMLNGQCAMEIVAITKTCISCSKSLVSDRNARCVNKQYCR